MSVIMLRAEAWYELLDTKQGMLRVSGQETDKRRSLKFVSEIQV